MDKPGLSDWDTMHQMELEMAIMAIAGNDRVGRDETGAARVHIALCSMTQAGAGA